MVGKHYVGRTSLVAAVVVAMLSTLVTPAIAVIPAPGSFSLTRTSWDVIGLDHNVKDSKTARWQDLTPRTFPVSRRVCNTSAVPATGVTATLSLGTGLNSQIGISPNSPSSLSIGTLASGACREASFSVTVGEGHSGEPDDLYGLTRAYTLTVAGEGFTSAPSGGTLYVEKLVSQNRNSGIRVESDACPVDTTICNVLAGQTYTVTLFSSSAPNGFEQTQAFLTIPLNLFEILDVRSHYSFPSGTSVDGVYGDGCGWDHANRKCTGRGKVGGNDIRTTYTLRALPTLTGSDVGSFQPMIYDLSGSSFHYDSDFNSPQATKTITASAAADVAVTMTHTGDMVRGSTGSYDVIARNDGPSSSGTLTAVISLPVDSDVTFATSPDHASGEGWTCVRTSDILLTCTHAALAPGDAAATLKPKVVLAATGPGTFSPSVVVSQSVADPSLLNNTATDLTTAKPAPESEEPGPVGANIQLTGPVSDLVVGAERTLTATVVDAGATTVTQGADATRSITFTQTDGTGAVTGLSTVDAVAGVATVTVTGSQRGPVSITAASTLSTGQKSSTPVTFTVVDGVGSLAPQALTFATGPVGSGSEPQTLTVTNIGTAPLTVGALALEGVNAADFSVVAQTCSATTPLAPEATCTFSIRFTPGASGPRVGSVRITTSAGPLLAGLSGSGSIGAPGNRAPVISVVVEPNPPRTNDVLRATVTVSDPDGDPIAVSYIWRVNGVVMRSQPATSALSDSYDLSLPARGDVSNLITVTATATDGSATASAAETVRVANTAPVAHSRTALVRVGSAGTAIALTATDADDQTLHYVITSLPATGDLKLGDRTIVASDLPFLVSQTVSGVTLHPSAITYVPKLESAGTDAFSFRAVDTDPVLPLSSGDATITVGIFENGAGASGTTSTENNSTVSSGTPDQAAPLRASVAAGVEGLFVSIEDVAPSFNSPPANYSVLGVEQKLHIKNSADPDATDATADAASPFRITFSFLVGLLPAGANEHNVMITRNGTLVPECSSDAQLPQDQQPCVSERLHDGDVVRIVVLTLNASLWNFLAPSAPDTGIVAAYQGATSAGAPNDPGAPLAPTAGTLSGFAFSSDDAGASFECRLTRAGGTTNYANWTGCVSGATNYVITGAAHPDDLYTFEVRARSGVVTDATPARRDFVVDRSAVSVQVNSGPGAGHTTTSALFAFAADKVGAAFSCMLRLQSAVAGAYAPCSSPHAVTGLTPGSAYEFSVRAVDDAGNSGAASWLFSVAAKATDDPGLPIPDTTPETKPDGGIAGPLTGGDGERISGPGRAGTAAALAQRFFKPGLPVVYVARDDDFPDALTATPLAVRDGAPILLVSTGALPRETALALRYLAPGRIVVLGGPAAVGPDVLDSLRGFAGRVDRLSGVDRFATAVMISQSIAPQGNDTVFIATGETFPDALACGGASARLGAPVLLVTRHGLPQVTAEELTRLGARRIVVVGGTNTIDAAVLTLVQQLTGVKPERVAGRDRYATAAAVSQAFFPAPAPAAFVATGEQFADALTAGPVSGKLGGPVLLVRPEQLPPRVAQELGRMQPELLVVLGGHAAVTPATEAALDAARRAPQAQP